MAYRFQLSGGYTMTPLGSGLSFVPNVDAPIDETTQLTKKMVDTVTLDVDAPVSVGFGGVANANIVLLKVTYGASVRARITSAAGVEQSIPFDTYLILMSMENPITAIDLTRTPATETEVEVILGEQG